MAPTEVTTWHLEQRSPDELRPSRRAPAEPVTLVRAEVPLPELNRFLYTAVGGDWWWWVRLSWTYADWTEWVERPDVETWVASVRGTPAGYFELQRQDGGDVEIAYFGLIPRFIGMGIGGWLLTEALRRAWAIDGTTRVWLHTCTLDGPHARANYEARGLRLFRTETAVEHLPDDAPGPWPGARRRP
jgi:GNAT superfamily N-acetyltransferase